MFFKIQGWVSESWTNSYEYVETKFSKFGGWVSGSRTDKPVPTNNSFHTWALGKYCDFYPVLHSLLRGIGFGTLADATAYFNVWMMRPEPSVNSWYWDAAMILKVGTLILISCLFIFYVCWKVFLFFISKIDWLSCCKHVCRFHQLMSSPSSSYSYAPLCNNIQPPLLQQTQQYYAQPHQSQQYHAQLRQELLEAEILEAENLVSQGEFTPGFTVMQHPMNHQVSIPSPSMPYSHAQYCNNIQPRMHAGQFSTPPRSKHRTPPRSEHRLSVNAHTGLLEVIEPRLYLNEPKLDYSAKKMM